MVTSRQFAIIPLAAMVMLLGACFQGCENNPKVSYNVNGDWIDVSSDGNTTTITLDQQNVTLTGTLEDNEGWTGTVQGTIQGDQVSMTYTYSDGFVVYNEGTVDDEGMYGIYRTIDAPAWSTWSATRPDAPQPELPVDSSPAPLPEPEYPLDDSFNPMFMDSVSAVIRSDSDWEALVGEYQSAAYDEVSAPVTGDEMVVFVYMGEHSTGGYSVEIDDVVEGDGAIVVSCTYRLPPLDADVTMAYSYPCAAVRIPYSDLPVEFDMAIVY